MLISSDKFLKGNRNKGNICQPFDSLCKHIRLSAKSERRRAAIDQEEIGPFLCLVAAGVFSPEQTTKPRGQCVRGGAAWQIKALFTLKYRDPVFFIKT